jgi:3-oxoacid CoA-transferase subunit B
VVDVIITDLCVMACDKRRGRLTLLELAPGVTLDEVRKKTGADFDASKPLLQHAA